MPAKATAGSAPDLQPRQPVEQEVDLELGAGGLGRRVRVLAEQDPQHPRSDPGQHPAAGDAAGGGAVVPRDLGPVPVGADGADPGAGDDLGPRRGGAAGQRVGDRAHAAHGHPPLAGAVADQVVEEAAVLDQRRVVQRREGADEGVGRHHAADRVVGEARLDRLPQGIAHHVAPDAGVDGVAQVPLVGERLGQRRRHGVRQVGDVGVELAPRVVLRVAAGELGERRARRLALGALDEQSAVAAVADPRRVRRGGARREGHVEVEVGHQGLGHQADQVGVAREPRRLAGERADRDRRAAGVVQPLEEQDREPGPAEVGGGDEPVVPTPDDHDVIAGLRRSHAGQPSPGASLAEQCGPVTLAR